MPHIRFSVTFSAMYALLLLFILYLLKMCTFQAQAEDYFYETIRHWFRCNKVSVDTQKAHFFQSFLSMVAHRTEHRTTETNNKHSAGLENKPWFLPVEAVIGNHIKSVTFLRSG